MIKGSSINLKFIEYLKIMVYVNANNDIPSTSQVPTQETTPPTSAQSETSTDELYYPSGRFVLNPDENHDKYEYERSGTDAGLVVIFNQEIFENDDKRSGTNRDVNELITTFGRLGYNVDEEHIHTDFTRNMIIEELKKLSKQDHSRRNSLIVIMLTHGDVTDTLKTKNGLIFTPDIWRPFRSENCQTLKNKPKLFIFQACKGAETSSPIATKVPVIPKSVYRAPCDSDMLLAFSAVEGTLSYRHPYEGSWFIQEMCKNFSTFGRRDDVVSLLIRTTKCVANNYYHVTKGSSCVNKQMPLFISTLKKKFYLTKSKDRKLILQLLKQQNDLTNSINDIQQRVNAMYEKCLQQRK